MEFCVAQTSLAHTYGNITCFIANYMKNLFPQGFFKTVHISTAIAYKQFSVFQNSNKEILKKGKPMLIIRPRIEVDDSSVFLYDTLMTTNWHNIYMETSFTNLQPFLSDKERGIYIKYLLNRLKMTFDITIITETQMDAINQAHFLKNRLPINYSLFLPTCLESYIPRDLLKVVSEDIGIPMYDENNSVRNFVEYLNSHSQYPVSYKMKNGTGNDEFFRYYPANVDVTFSGLSVDDVTKKGMVSDTCAVNITLTAEFNATGLYYFFTERHRRIDKFIMDMHATRDDKIIPIFTQDNLYVSKYGTGWNVYTAPMYAVDNDTRDILNIEQVLNNSIISTIKYHIEHGIPIELFCKIEVMKDNRYLIPLTEYDVNYNTLELITKNCNMNSTYRLIVHINTEYVNSLVSDIFDLTREK